MKKEERSWKSIKEGWKGKRNSRRRMTIKKQMIAAVAPDECYQRDATLRAANRSSKSRSSSKSSGSGSSGSSGRLIERRIESCDSCQLLLSWGWSFIRRKRTVSRNPRRRQPVDGGSDPPRGHMIIPRCAQTVMQRVTTRPGRGWGGRGQRLVGSLLDCLVWIVDKLLHACIALLATGIFVHFALTALPISPAKGAGIDRLASEKTNESRSNHPCSRLTAFALVIVVQSSVVTIPEGLLA